MSVFECKNNPGVQSGLKDCHPGCGWDPEVERLRKKALKEKHREESGQTQN